jgi:NAD+ kinase
MRTVGLVVRPAHEEAQKHADEVEKWLRERGHAVSRVDSRTDAVQRIATTCDPIITLGGDGTLIGVARWISSGSPTLIGVNFGSLGFLTDARPEELWGLLESVLSNKATYRERAMIVASIERNGQTVFSSQGLNDAVLMKEARSRLLQLDIHRDDEPVMRIRADGIIVATPTGSTAYSMAAGGSIVDPSLPVMLLTPICPHSLTSRPLILDMDSKLTITIPHFESKVFITIDGQVSHELQAGDKVSIVKSPRSLKIARSPHRSYFEILQAKLKWGIPAQE